MGLGVAVASVSHGGLECGLQIVDSCRTIQGLFPSLPPSVLEGLNRLAPINCSDLDSLLGSVPPLCVAYAASTVTLFPPPPASNPLDVCGEVKILSDSAVSCATLACGNLLHLLLLNPGIDCSNLQLSQMVCVAGVYTGPVCALPPPPPTPPPPPLLFPG